jgi:hypothetical protein
MSGSCLAHVVYCGLESGSIRQARQPCLRIPVKDKKDNSSFCVAFLPFSATKSFNYLEVPAVCQRESECGILSRRRSGVFLWFKLSNARMNAGHRNIRGNNGVKVQVRDAERNLRSYFRVAIIRAVSKARTDAARWCAGRSNKYWLIPVVFSQE